MKKFIIILLFIPSVIFAQKIPLNEIDFYMELINTVENYEKYSSLRKKSFYKKYDNLFSKEAKVFDDVIPSKTFGEYLMFNEYSMNIRSLKRKRLDVDIEILEIEDVSSDLKSGTVKVHVLITRNMAFGSKEGNLFYNEITEYVDWPQKTNCIISLDFNKYEDKNGDVTQEGVKFRISEIKSKETLKKLNAYIPFTKLILAKPKLYNDTLPIFLDGEKIEFKGEKINYFINNNINKKENNITIKGKETELVFSNVKPIKGSSFAYQLTFREKMPVYVNYNIDLGTEFSLKNTNSNLKIPNQTFTENNSFSLTAYLYKPDWLSSKEFYGSKIRTQIGVNFLISESILNISNAEFTSVEQNKTDIDGHNYIRTNYINNINEEFTISSILLNVGARLDIDKKIEYNKKFYAVQIGAFVNALLAPIQKSANSTINAVGNYSGEYEQLSGLVIGDDEQFDRYDLGTYSLSSSNDLQIEYPLLSTFEIGVVGDYFLPSQWGVSLSLSNIISNSSLTEKQFQDLSTGSDNINSLLELIDEFNVNSKIKFKIGLIRKL
tara:strand:- start:403 stop:2052 length:1650 start_codon:yes stop_codon:yes gene_type:complete